jgi:hypothetical protein
MSATKPATKAELKEYCLRRLGKPVLDINVDDSQVEDLVEEAVQYYNERHFEGVERMFLKHEFTAADVTRFKSSNVTNTSPSGDAWSERNNYIEVPDHVIGINKIFGMTSSSIRGNMFGIEYQLFLNDLYQFGAVDILNYYMTKSYLEDLDFVLNSGAMVQFRFNKRVDRLYIDVDPNDVKEGQFIIIDCHRALDPTTMTQVYNDSFLKKYLTSLVKRQWGQNLIKFKGVKFPGGVELDGRQIYDDAVGELKDLEDKMLSTYELPPLDMIG